MGRKKKTTLSRNARNATQFYSNQRPGRLIRWKARAKCREESKNNIKQFLSGTLKQPGTTRYGYVLFAQDIALILGFSRDSVPELKKLGVFPEPYAVDKHKGLVYTVHQARIIVESYYDCMNDLGEVDYECYQRTIDKNYVFSKFMSDGLSNKKRRRDSSSVKRIWPRRGRRPIR